MVQTDFIIALVAFGLPGGTGLCRGPCSASPKESGPNSMPALEMKGPTQSPSSALFLPGGEVDLQEEGSCPKIHNLLDMNLGPESDC